MKEISSKTRIDIACIDRIAYALNQYRSDFVRDINSTSVNKTALQFIRSPKAWSTHPSNYYAAENSVTAISQKLFNQSLDFCWCHMAINQSQLANVLPKIKSHDLLFFAETILLLIPDITTQEVDWLSWEDPFILNLDPQKCKSEQEHNPQQTAKRLSYTIPMINLLFDRFHQSN